MKETVRQEKNTFAEYAVLAAELGAKEGHLSEKSLCRHLGIHAPTAVKLLCAFDMAGLLGDEDKKKGFVWQGNADDVAALKTRRDSLGQTYLPLVERDKDFEKLGYTGYLFGTLVPALKLGLTFGSLSVIFLQRKMSVVNERAHEIYDLLGICGFYDGDDPINPGRKLMTVTHSDYDGMYVRLEKRK